MADDITPALVDVGAILRARTRDANGNETGTFGSTTRPTGDEVQSYIDQAEPEVRLRLPEDIPTDLEPFVKRLVALRAAMFVEMAADPDRAGEESAFERLREMYDTGIAALLSRLDDRGEDVETGGRMVEATVASPYSGPPITYVDLLQ